MDTGIEGGTSSFKKGKGSLYSAASSSLDTSKHSTLFAPLSDLFIPTPTRLRREAF